MKADNAKQPFSLSIKNWIVIILLTVLVPTLGFWLPKLFTMLAALTELGTYITAAFALAVSAWSAFNSHNIKVFELQRGYRAANHLVSADAQGALVQANEIIKELNSLEASDEDKWNELVDQINRYSRRYDKKQEQLPLLSTYFAADEFLTIRDLYLAIEDIWIESERYSVKTPDGLSVSEKTSLIGERITGLMMSLEISAKNVVRYYQELRLIELPAELNSTMRKTE